MRTCRTEEKPMRKFFLEGRWLSFIYKELCESPSWIVISCHVIRSTPASEESAPMAALGIWLWCHCGPCLCIPSSVSSVV